MKYVEVGKYLVLFSEVSSFQASVARTLLDIGGDVGIAYGLNEKETRISVRSTQRFFKETKIDLGSILSEISGEQNNNTGTSPDLPGATGGGHSTAASFACLARNQKMW